MHLIEFFLHLKQHILIVEDAGKYPVSQEE